jgi:hypothetical protein
VGEEDHVLDDAVEDVAVEHEVAAAGGVEDVVFDEAEVLELHGEEAGEEVVVVAA